MTQSESAPDRGRVRIERRAVEKIAAQAASEVAATGGSTGGFLGVHKRHDFNARPQVSVDLRGADADITVSCGLRYPAPLRETTDEIRRYLRDRVEQLAGIGVHRVDIEVTWLSTTATAADSRHLS